MLFTLYRPKGGRKAVGRRDVGEFCSLKLVCVCVCVCVCVQVTLDAHFKKDLGLDSLDHVEVIMVFEDHFRKLCTWYMQTHRG